METSDVQPDVESNRDSSPDFNTLYFFKRSIGESTESMYSRSESMYSRGDSRDVWWSDVNYSVGETKILQGCWGHVATGNLCAIMGPSGAGKSSLLNVLAGRSAASNDCVMKVGAIRVKPANFRRHIAYVTQEDSLMATATPREALMFSARLRLPAEVSSEDTVKTVEKLLKELGLLECADVVIGSALVKGISGGQRKRTSVGIELVTDPMLLFLDEPTTGLDSHSASVLVKLLRKVAMKNATILCTIHQPSSDVFAQFDSVIFLKDGRVFYQGSAWEVNLYYNFLGHKCPENYNPADFVMNLSQSLSGKELEDLFMPTPEHVSDKTLAARTEIVEKVPFQLQRGFYEQVAALTNRAWTGMYRSPHAQLIRFAVIIVMNLIYGCVFWRTGELDLASSGNMNAHVALVVNSMIFTTCMSSQCSILTFPLERPIFQREFASGTYSATAYMLSKLAFDAPIVLAEMFLQYMFVKVMSGLQGDYVQFVGIGFGLSMVMNSLGMLVGAVITDAKDVAELAVFVFVPQILFAGLFTRLNQIPAFLRWAQYLCGLSYATKLAFLIEFNPSQDLCRASDAARANCASIIASGGPSADSYWVPIVGLAVICLIARVATAAVLVAKAHKQG